MKSPARWRKLDRSTPDYIKRAVLQRRYSELSGGNQFRPSLPRRKPRAFTREERDPTRQRELEQIASNCTRVPEYGATTSGSLRQTFWFIQSMLQIESSGHSILPAVSISTCIHIWRQTPPSAANLPGAGGLLLIKLNDINKTWR